MNYGDILNALKNGNVPSEGAYEFSVGRDKELEEFKYLLSQVNEGKSFVKFLKGDYGEGKSFFLKAVEEYAFKENFAVSWVGISDETPFHKIDVIYRNIAKNVKCKTGISLQHMIERWLTNIKMMALEESDDPQVQNEIVIKNIRSDLVDVRLYSNPFATAIESYHKFVNMSDNEMADYVQSWLRGDGNIPFTIKRRFGVKGDVDKENALKFLQALSVFVKSVGYKGLLVIFDEAEFIMTVPRKQSRKVAFNYIRDLYDDCSFGKFQNTFFIFAGTRDFFDDQNLGVPSYPALDDRIKDEIDSEYPDLRKPVIDLKGFDNENLTDLARKLMIMHEEVYKWNAHEKFEVIFPELISIHEKKRGLSKGRVTPRTFIRSFISILDTVQQNQSHFNSPQDILAIFEDKEEELEELLLEDDW